MSTTTQPTSVTTDATPASLRSVPFTDGDLNVVYGVKGTTLLAASYVQHLAHDLGKRVLVLTHTKKPARKLATTWFANLGERAARNVIIDETDHATPDKLRERVEQAENEHGEFALIVVLDLYRYRHAGRMNVGDVQIATAVANLTYDHRNATKVGTVADLRSAPPARRTVLATTESTRDGDPIGTDAIRSAAATLLHIVSSERRTTENPDGPAAHVLTVQTRKSRYVKPRHELVRVCAVEQDSTYPRVF